MIYKKPAKYIYKVDLIALEFHNLSKLYTIVTLLRYTIVSFQGNIKNQILTILSKKFTNPLMIQNPKWH